MISLETAKLLKKAGLPWKPEQFDFFAIPDRMMDDKVFVIADMLVTVEMLQGLQVVSFQGASEWALDSLVTTEAIWLPREDQLRQHLEAILLEIGKPEWRLSCGVAGCRLELPLAGKPETFDHRDLSEAYAMALLFLLRGANQRAAFQG